MNPAGRTKASVGPEGRTERSNKQTAMMADTDARTDHETDDGS